MEGAIVRVFLLGRCKSRFHRQNDRQSPDDTRRRQQNRVGCGRTLPWFLFFCSRSKKEGKMVHQVHYKLQIGSITRSFRGGDGVRYKGQWNWGDG